MLTHTISYVELAWTLFTTLGLIFNGNLLRQAAGDYQALRARKINSVREFAAITVVFTYSTWTFVQFMFVLLGLLAMTQASPSGRVQPFSYVITVGFIAISALLALSGYIVNVRRKALIDRIRRIEEDE